MQETYKCSICGNDYDTSLYYLNTKGQRKSTKCKKCYCKEQYKHDKESPAKQKYKEDHKDTNKEYRSDRYQRIKDTQEYKDQMRECHRRYRQSNKGKKKIKERLEDKKNYHLIKINKQLRIARIKYKEDKNINDRISKYTPIADKYNISISDIKKEWKCIKGYEGMYKVSNYGQVYSLLTNRVLNQVKTLYGYHQVNLHKDHKQITFKVHRLVAETFIENPYNKLEINHIDSDRTNNMVSNLEWTTRQENIDHRVCVKLNLINNDND